MIDTLILSGGSSKGISYIGILYELNKYNIINKKKIKNIISCSSGSIFGFMYLLDFTTSMMYKIMTNIDIINIKNLNEKDMFLNNGIMNNDNIYNTLKICLKYKYNKLDITFKELFDITKIKFIIKVFNLSLDKDQYFSYVNKPNMSILKTIQMSTCIPIIFKPIKYNNNYYIDGGIIDSNPFIKKKIYKNHLIINFCNKKDENINYYDLDIMNYLNNIIGLLMSNKKIKNKKNILINNNMSFLEFNIKNIDDILIDSIKQTNNHILKYYL